MAAQKGVALVTGASSGIGAVYADRLARRGHDLVLVARDKGRLSALAVKLTGAYGVRVDVLPADLANPAELAVVADRIVADKSIDILVNNAGVGPSGPAAGSAPDVQERLIAVNVTAVQRLAFAAAGAFAKRGQGTIINIASAVALAPERFSAGYAASKAFVLAMTQSLAAELATGGVRFQAVMPGFTRTEIFDRAGGSIDQIPTEMLMEVGDMVDAALAGLDAGELVTIPSLPDVAQWTGFEAARHALQPNLSHSKPAARFGVAAGNP